MAKEQTATSARLLKFKRDFPKAAAIIVKKLGEKPFHARGPLNSSVLDAVFSTILDNLNRIPEDLGKRYDRLLRDKPFTQATYYSTSDVIVVKERFKRAREFLL